MTCHIMVGVTLIGHKADMLACLQDGTWLVTLWLVWHSLDTRLTCWLVSQMVHDLSHYGWCHTHWTQGRHVGLSPRWYMTCHIMVGVTLIGHKADMLACLQDGTWLVTLWLVSHSLDTRQTCWLVSKMVHDLSHYGWCDTHWTQGRHVGLSPRWYMTCHIMVGVTLIGHKADMLACLQDGTWLVTLWLVWHSLDTRQTCWLVSQMVHDLSHYGWCHTHWTQGRHVGLSPRWYMTCHIMVGVTLIGHKADMLACLQDGTWLVTLWLVWHSLDTRQTCWLVSQMVHDLSHYGWCHTHWTQGRHVGLSPRWYMTCHIMVGVTLIGHKADMLVCLPDGTWLVTLWLVWHSLDTRQTCWLAHCLSLPRCICAFRRQPQQLHTASRARAWLRSMDGLPRKLNRVSCVKRCVNHQCGQALVMAVVKMETLHAGGKQVVRCCMMGHVLIPVLLLMFWCSLVQITPAISTTTTIITHTCMRSWCSHVPVY